MSVQDVIKKSVLESAMYTTHLDAGTIATIVADLLIAVLMGWIIYMVYKKCYKGVIYSRNFAMSLMGMTILTCVVTLAISTNIVISLGMVGALSIVRYRTAIKEPLDLMYMFWAITTGITVGASMYLMAFLSAAIMFFVVLGFSKNIGSGKDYILIAHYDVDIAGDEIIRQLYRVKYNVRSKIMKGSQTELTLQIRSKSINSVDIEKLREINGVKDVALLSFDGEYHE